MSREERKRERERESARMCERAVVIVIISHSHLSLIFDVVLLPNGKEALFRCPTSMAGFVLRSVFFLPNKVRPCLRLATEALLPLSNKNNNNQQKSERTSLDAL